MMTKRDILQYKSVSADDQRTFDRWLKASAVVGSIFVAVVVVMAIASSDLGPRQAHAKNTKATEFGAAETPAERSGVMLKYQIVF